MPYKEIGEGFIRNYEFIKVNLFIKSKVWGLLGRLDDDRHYSRLKPYLSGKCLGEAGARGGQIKRKDIRANSGTGWEERGELSDRKGPGGTGRVSKAEQSWHQVLNQYTFEREGDLETRHPEFPHSHLWGQPDQAFWSGVASIIV